MATGPPIYVPRLKNLNVTMDECERLLCLAHLFALLISDKIPARHAVVLSLDDTRAQEKTQAIEASRNEEVQTHEEKVRR